MPAAVDLSPPTRNLQLDFFRGLALMIIFINHMPGNPWFHYTPSRLGPSDAAETFVFLSGFAAAIAFGRSFSQAGIGIGMIRVLFRCAQIYAAHLGLFVLMTTTFVLMNALQIIGAGWHLDNLDYFFDHTQTALLALVSLHYVPNFIGILPMYLVIMLWVPLAWSLSRIHTALAVAFPIALYAAARIDGWELTADPVSSQSWHFNPFCWQLIFFTGFAFASGWLPIPRFNRTLTYLCLAFVAFCFPLENEFGYQRLTWFATLRDEWAPLLDKDHLGLVRYLHFLAVAYLANNLVRRQQRWLQTAVAGTIIGMGRQSLPIFILGACLSFVGGALLDGTGASLLDSAWVNIAGLGLMTLSAQLLNWLDQKPWKSAVRRTGSPSQFAWTLQPALMLILFVLATIPVLFLQPQQTPAVVAASQPDSVVSPDPPAIDTEEVVYQPSGDTIDIPDPL